ncbi:hypothetical protein FRC10_007170 [Ceratobasidium sp. 414]|nr:hypothetical protein FRC10_007170 [Ceratobasidium sp. 414]
MDWGKYVAILPYGDRWKEHRRMMHTWLQKNAVRSFQQSQEQQTRMLLVRLLASSDHLQDELYRTIAATLLRSVYGYQLEALNDPFVLGAKKAIDNLARAAMSTTSQRLSQTFSLTPSLPYPTSRAGSHGLAGSGPPENSAHGSNESSIVRALLDAPPKADLSRSDLEDYVKHIAIALFGAGSDTVQIHLSRREMRWLMIISFQTVASLEVFVIAMIRHPEVQVKAQTEIDRVVGTKRLPTFEDRSQLPYIDQIMKEVMRWQPVTPLAVPHTSTQDDVYREYRIPKGAIVAMSRNEQVYPEPETFNPERFSDPNVPSVPGFGFGRRQVQTLKAYQRLLCPGMHYAEASIFIAIASILATYKITPVKDDDGKDIIPSTEGVADSVV